MENNKEIQKELQKELYDNGYIYQIEETSTYNILTKSTKEFDKIIADLIEEKGTNIIITPNILLEYIRDIN